MRSRFGVHIDYSDSQFNERIWAFNVSSLESFICHSPPLDEAIGGYNHRVVTATVPVVITLNSHLYGEAVAQNFTYYYS